jgi:hypothetical protein
MINRIVYREEPEVLLKDERCHVFVIEGYRRELDAVRNLASPRHAYTNELYQHLDMCLKDRGGLVEIYEVLDSQIEDRFAFIDYTDIRVFDVPMKIFSKSKVSGNGLLREALL